MATQPCGPLRGWKAYTLASAAPGQESLRNFLELSELPRAASHPPPGLPDPGLPDPGLPSSGALPISTRGLRVGQGRWAQKQHGVCRLVWVTAPQEVGVLRDPQTQLRKVTLQTVGGGCRVWA